MSTQLGHVQTSINNHIGTVTFFHPSSNSLPGAILNELANSITSLAAHPEVRVLILQSEGNKAFCAGACRLIACALAFVGSQSYLGSDEPNFPSRPRADPRLGDCDRVPRGRAWLCCAPAR